MNGTLRMANPGESVVTLTWRGGISVAAGGVEHVAWPPSYEDGAATIDADGDVFLTWVADKDQSTTDAVPGVMYLACRRHRRFVRWSLFVRQLGQRYRGNHGHPDGRLHEHVEHDRGNNHRRCVP